MLSFPNAKINLGLNIIEKRSDGFHNIESCFFPIPWRDMLEIIPAEKTSFSSTGIEIPESKSGNLCLQAYNLLKADFDLPPVKIHLHKIIPIGAGLGGGSADGSFALKMLNEKFDLKITSQKLEEYALQMGSDCPFFIENKPVLVLGRGEAFEEIELDLSGKFITLVNPNIHISTKEAYSGIVPKQPEKPISTILGNHISTWENELQNDFENHLFESYEILPRIKSELYDKGCQYASMTGSGSTLFGISEQKIDLVGFEDLMVFQAEL
ncbi:MAG: 4-diphosphocytidyl-2-C-methyl-D-erythritol kinase [Arenicella sp.]|jgi:4-diphosphocytidyl-2-C-methyl-D-erythritol kinase